MQTKYKLGERVLFNDENGIEQLATITGVTIDITTQGVTTNYHANQVKFSETHIVGKVNVTLTPVKRTRKSKKKILQETLNLGGVKYAATIDATPNDSSNLNGAA